MTTGKSDCVFVQGFYIDKAIEMMQLIPSFFSHREERERQVEREFILFFLSFFI